MELGDLNREYWNMDIETKLNTPEIKELQLEKLKKALKWQYENTPFNRKRFDKAGVKPEDIQSFEDYAQAIPVAGQADLREIIQEVGLDMDALMRELFGPSRMDDLYLITTTSGTTGIPTPYPNFHAGIREMKELFHRVAWRMGMRPGDRVGLCFGLSMHAAGTPQILWFQDFPGITIVPIGAEAGTEKILQFLKLFKANIFTGTPSLALHLIEKCPEVLGHPVKDLGIKLMMLGAEPGAGIPEVRQKLESEYGAKVYDGGGGYGCSCDYPIYQGMHWLADDLCYYELLDPKTGASVPMENGATGLMAATSLNPAGAVWFDMRFTLNDIHQVFTDPCPCGKTGFRYKIVGRADDMLKVKGVPVYPASIEGVIHSFPQELTGAFRIVLDEPPPRVVPPLKLKIEYTENVREEELPYLEEKVRAKMKSLLKVNPAIMWLQPNTLERAVKKTQVLEKTYE
ncbi:phenylacetate-CoA ligase [Desulfatibacillum alkenivorans DSM 16219]|jgi:phenylacetate-CoA ligase|uniref:Phenylacetate-CoA ligase n=1 Tax=Desulfatibacillum alkenivorans DSM 16219 TaxID=1121393 RepID=A0A1M6TEJ0_9BACT|nr:AMP-binding protein [Desulfatibacillum alkenivorans]SHK55390.1 phenylacetate-CoA ligase [Desulfatibacillum alkenivorans DSM 16219]